MYLEMPKIQSIPLLIDPVYLPSQTIFCQHVDFENSNLRELGWGSNCVNSSYHMPLTNNNQVLQNN